MISSKNLVVADVFGSDESSGLFEFRTFRKTVMKLFGEIHKDALPIKILREKDNSSMYLKFMHDGY